MSTGRPQQPAPWAEGGNYPAGGSPWNSTPLRVKGANDYLTPGTPEAAQKLNWQMGDSADRLLDLLFWSGQTPAQNWRSNQVAPGGQNWQCSAYDPYGKCWVAVSWVNSAGSSVFRLLVSYDGGQTWAHPAADFNAGAETSWVACDVVPFFVSSDMAFAQGKYLVLLVDGSNTLDSKIVEFDCQAGTATMVEHFTGVQGTAGRMTRFAGLYVAIYPNNHGTLHTSPDGTTWTARTIPAPLSGDSNLFDWDYAQSSTVMIACPRTANVRDMMKSTDGITWTAILGPALAAGDKLSALAHGTDAAGNDAFYLAVAEADGATTLFYKSTDNGATWVSQGSTGNGRWVSGMACLGSLLVAVTEDQTLHISRTIFSIDGGIFWRQAAQYLSDNIAVGSPPYVRPRVLSNTVTGFVQNNAKILSVSTEAGLPAAI